MKKTQTQDEVLKELIQKAQNLVDFFAFHNKNTTKAQDAVVDDLKMALQRLKK